MPDALRDAVIPGQIVLSGHSPQLDKPWQHACTWPERKQTLRGKMTKSEANARLLQQANNAFKTIGGETPMTDYVKSQRSFHENLARLKAERLAREGKSKDGAE